MPNALHVAALVSTILLALACAHAAKAGTAVAPSAAPLTPAQGEAHCATYAALYANIDADLARWKADGVSLELMQRTIASHSTRKAGQKGIAAGFWQGRAYLLDEPEISGAGHHAQLLFIYMRYLLYLEKTFVMPDVEFVINTIDRPLGLQVNASSSDEPVFRFCKSDSHADVLIPIFHFNMKDFDGGILEKVPEINKAYPWDKKKDKVFGRFSLYARHFHSQDPAMPVRLGAGGAEICTTSRSLVTSCSVRKHFVQWSKGYKDMDVSNGGRITMPEHGNFKYLIHLDGQGLSSRFDQLLPLGSLVLKEASGYRAFYHHLTKPYEHYVPFWKERPDDILDVLKWARANDSEARRIAENGQQLALKYLNRNARACYWYHLTGELSKLQKYTHGKVAGRQYMEYYKPINEYLETIAKRHEGGKAWEFVKKFTP